MIRVEQRHFEKGDCGVSCVAMVTGLSYDVVEQSFESHGLVRGGNYYTFHRDLIKILTSLGYVVKRRRFSTWKEVACPAIVKINVRTGNFWHWVVLAEQGKLFDPKPGSSRVVSDYRGRKGSGQYLEVCGKAIL